MPVKRTLRYQFSGNVTQEYYTEAEMAEALFLDVKDLRRALDTFSYGNGWSDPGLQGYVYHLHPLANDGEFLFTTDCYKHNLLVRDARTWLTDQGWWRNHEACGAYMASVFPWEQWGNGLADDALFLSLNKFIAAWDARDVNYDRSIKTYVKVSDGIRLIYEKLGCLNGVGIIHGERGVTFYNLSGLEPAWFVPWIRLGVSPELGFFDMEKFPYTRTQILPGSNEIGKYDFFEYNGMDIPPGRLVFGKRFVYDEMIPFFGLVIECKSESMIITQDGRLLDEIEKLEICSVSVQGMGY